MTDERYFVVESPLESGAPSLAASTMRATRRLDVARLRRAGMTRTWVRRATHSLNRLVGDAQPGAKMKFTSMPLPTFCRAPRCDLQACQDQLGSFL